MKQVCMYVDNVDDNQGPQYRSEYYRRAYTYFYRSLRMLNAQIIIVHDQQVSYIGNGRFSWYWEPVFDASGEVLSYRKIEKVIAVSIVFDKARFDATDVTIINPKRLTQICIDKFKTYNFIPNIHPKTFLIENKEALANGLNKISRDEIIVIKSVDSDGGEEVFIGNKEGFKDNFSYPLAIQEFLDSSRGIPGLCKGTHDLRIAVFDGEVLYGRLRTPPRGGLIANISFGGEEEIISVALLPEKLFELTRIIDEKFKLGNEHRYYAIDYIFSNNRWHVLEMNAWPGFLDPSLGSESKKSIEKLAYKLVSV